MKNFRILMLVAMCLVFMAGCGDDELIVSPDSEVDRNLQETTELIAGTTSDYVLAFFPLVDDESMTEGETTYISHSYTINSTAEVARIAIEKLLTGAPDFACADAIVDGVKLVNLYETDGIIYISLSYETTLTEADIDFNAFSYTVNFANNGGDMSFAEILPITILVNDKVIGEAKYQAPALNITDDFNEDDTTVQVFVGDSQAMHVLPLTFEVKSNLEGEELYLATLDIWAEIVAPKNTEILSVSLESNALTVNISAELVSYGGGSAYEWILLNSLLYTLAGFNEITSVQILVDGETIEYLPEGTTMNKVFTIDHEYRYLNAVN